jgi:hypothetical protein
MKTFVIIALLVFATHASAQTRAGMDLARLKAIATQLESSVKQGKMAGAVTLVARRGQVVSLQAVGYHDLASKTPMRVDSIFDMRSVTKPITAIAIMMLMEDGKLTLNDPVVGKFWAQRRFWRNRLDRSKGTVDQNIPRTQVRIFSREQRLHGNSRRGSCRLAWSYGFLTEPINSTTCVWLSRIAKKNGRSTFIENGFG